MKENTPCGGYFGVACIDGVCPKANRDDYMERGIPVVENCEDCIFHDGCEDCYFKGTKFCDKRDTEFKGVVIHEHTPELYDF